MILKVGEKTAKIDLSGNWVSLDSNLQTVLNLGYGSLLYPSSPSDGRFPRYAVEAAKALAGEIVSEEDDSAGGEMVY